MSDWTAEDEHDFQVSKAGEAAYLDLVGNVKLWYPDDEEARWEILQSVCSRLYEEGYTYDFTPAQMVKLEQMN